MLVVPSSWIKSRPWVLDLAFFALAALLLLHGRWPSILDPFPMNPDEAQAAANALRIHAYGANWTGLDGSTNGPLDSLVLCWPYLFGLDPTLNTGRVTACALLFCVCLCLYLAAKTLCGSRGLAMLLVLPLISFYSATSSPDFLHYSSELLPVALLSAACCLIARLSVGRVGSARREGAGYLLIGLLLGAVPFAKLQAVPMALLVALYTMVLALAFSRKDRWRNARLLCCGGVATAACFLLPLLVSGHIGDFWKSYIAWAFLYVKTPLTLVDIVKMITDDMAMSILVCFLSSLAVIALLHAVLRDWKAVAAGAAYGVIFSLALVATAVWIIVKPGRPFDHYLMFFPPFVVLVCASLVRVFAGRWADVRIFAVYYAALAALSIGLCYSHMATRREPAPPLVAPTFEARSPHILSWLPIPATHLLVWGWMPQWYVWSGLTPASRETNTFSQTTDSPMLGYFRARFMSDMDAASPEVILDGAEGKSFAFEHGRSPGPAAMPEFAAYLAGNYAQLSPWRPAPACPKLYVRKDLIALLDRRLVSPAAVQTSADFKGPDSRFGGGNLFDDSVTEDTCADYWLLPTRTTGSVTVSFAKLEPIARVMILNTRNAAYMDRATKSVQLSLLKAGVVVATQKLDVQPYPYWTSVQFQAPVQADQLKVEVLSYLGRGGGLNEIKIFRPDTAATAGDRDAASH